MSARGFRPISTAPRDGTVVVVRHGASQDPVRAFWATRAQGWVREHDTAYELLRDVNVWRPANNAALR
jgi:hypothetical protein